MKRFSIFLCGIFLFFLFVGPANAVLIDWVDWEGTTATVPGAYGTLAGGTVDVTYTGAYSFVQTGTGKNYWSEGSPAPYTSNAVVDNAPTAAEGIALSDAGMKTVTFSEAVLNPVFAFNSWNGSRTQGIDFGTPITILSEGWGYWGEGDIQLAFGGNGWMTLSGEPHGVVQLNGTFTSITFTDQLNEYWHGFTIGIEGVADDNNPVPEPSTTLLLGCGLLGLAGVTRRRLKK